MAKNNTAEYALAAGGIAALFLLGLGKKTQQGAGYGNRYYTVGGGYRYSYVNLPQYYGGGQAGNGSSGQGGYQLTRIPQNNNQRLQYYNGQGQPVVKRPAPPQNYFPEQRQRPNAPHIDKPDPGGGGSHPSGPGYVAVTPINPGLLTLPYYAPIPPVPNPTGTVTTYESGVALPPDYQYVPPYVYVTPLNPGLAPPVATVTTYESGVALPPDDYIPYIYVTPENPDLAQYSQPSGTVTTYEGSAIPGNNGDVSYVDVTPANPALYNYAYTPIVVTPENPFLAQYNQPTGTVTTYEGDDVSGSVIPYVTVTPPVQNYAPSYVPPDDYSPPYIYVTPPVQPTTPLPPVSYATAYSAPYIPPLQYTPPYSYVAPVEYQPPYVYVTPQVQPTIPPPVVTYASAYIPPPKPVYVPPPLVIDPSEHVLPGQPGEYYNPSDPIPWYSMWLDGWRAGNDPNWKPATPPGYAHIYEGVIAPPPPPPPPPPVDPSEHVLPGQPGAVFDPNDTIPWYAMWLDGWRADNDPNWKPATPPGYAHVYTYESNIGTVVPTPPPPPPPATPSRYQASADPNARVLPGYGGATYDPTLWAMFQDGWIAYPGWRPAGPPQGQVTTYESGVALPTVSSYQPPANPASAGGYSPPYVSVTPLNPGLQQYAYGERYAPDYWKANGFTYINDKFAPIYDPNTLQNIYNFSNPPPNPANYIVHYRQYYNPGEGYGD